MEKWDNQTPKLFQRALRNWFRREARDLPWRRTRDPYCVWLSEIMLQQTRVEQGLPYYERFIAALPDVTALARAHEDRVLKLWEGLGYYTRARNLHRAARIIVDELHGEFPGTAEAWRKLPGVGQYTANAIASIAFDEPVAVLDGNVMRVLSRLLNMRACIDQPRTRERLWKIAAQFVPEKKPGDHNQAMMELGARICLPTRPQCAQCPVKQFCRAFELNVQEKRPVRREKKQTPHYEVAAAVVRRSRRFLLVKRPAEGLLAGLWEYPQARVESGETHDETLTRLMKKLGFNIVVQECIAFVPHEFSHFSVGVHFYKCSLTGKGSRAKAGPNQTWASPDEMAQLALPKTMHKALSILRV